MQSEQETRRPPTKRTLKPEIAGILDIIGGLACGITGYHVITSINTDEGNFVIFFVLALLALTGGIFSITRTMWGLAMVGPIALFLGLGWVVINLIDYLIGGIFGHEIAPFSLTMLSIVVIFLVGGSIAVLIFTINCKDEFR